MRNPTGGKSRQANTCSSASQQPVSTRNNSTRISQASSAKQKSISVKEGDAFPQNQLLSEMSLTSQQMVSDQVKQILESNGHRLTEQQIQQL